MQCQKCGNNNSPGARFCASCGAPLAANATPATAPLSPGQSMNRGQYRVVRALGKGGMGAIYLAQNTQAFDRLCVIKEMLAYYEPGEESKAQARFEEEARTLANLKHPGIPDMYGYFSESGHNYIVMEYIEGDDFEKLQARRAADGSGAPSEDDIVRYGIELCRVLEYLAGVQPTPVVHCDIKPANIILDRNSQQAVLVDFGTAKGRSPRTPAADRNRVATPAPSGKRPSVYGTVGYAAPEMFSGQAVPKSDVFALAATLYFMLTGDDPRDHPFQWPQMDRLPAALHLILERALAEKMDERLDAEQFRQQLDAYRASKAGTIQPLTFPGGNQATTVTGVLDLALRYWEYARQILYDGSLDAWLRQVAHDPVAADRAREAIAENPNAPDAGLDTFVRSLNPRMPDPRLEIALDSASSTRSRATTAHLTLTNHGPGGSRGSIAGSGPNVRPGATTYVLAPGAQLAFSVEVKNPDASPRIVVTPTAGQPLTADLRAASTRAAQGSARPPATLKPTPKPTPRPARAPAPTKRRSIGSWLVGLVVLLFAALIFSYVYQQLVTPGAGAIEAGIAALQAGDWTKAQRALSRVDPTDQALVEQAGAALDAEMVFLPGGMLTMGADDGALDQRPAHDVAVGDFAFDRFEVTNVQYQHFVNATGHRPPEHWGAGHYRQGEAMLPVVNVTWADAQAYAAWLGKRLPTEAEWEWAARGPEGRLYPWGDESDSLRVNTKERGPGRLADVGSYPLGATPEGVQDLGGNVREWTADYYDLYTASPSPPLDGAFVAIRGSSWNTYDDVALARQKLPPSELAHDLGFRCAREY